MTNWEIDTLALALLREMWRRMVRWAVFGLVALGLMGTVGVLGLLIGLKQAGG